MMNSVMTAPKNPIIAQTYVLFRFKTIQFEVSGTLLPRMNGAGGPFCEIFRL